MKKGNVEKSVNEITIIHNFDKTNQSLIYRQQSDHK